MERLDPLLQPSWKRLVIFPIECHMAWQMYKKAQALFWTPEEINFSHDFKDYETLTSTEQVLIGNVLAFFAASDGLVCENLAENFLQEVQLPEVRAFYAIQIYMENIHSETYSLLIDTYYKDPQKKTALLQAVLTDPAVMRKADFAEHYVRNKTYSFARRLLAFACIEMIFFCGAFAILFWLKSRGKMPGLTFSNDLIARDESLHVEFACWLYSTLQTKMTEEEVKRLVDTAVTIEKQFWSSSFEDRALGMNEELMCQYVEFIADRLLLMLGIEKVYGSSNPFPFAETSSLEGKSNFFERRVPEYRKFCVGSSASENHNFTLDADF